MSHSFVPKLESILDKQSKIPHTSFADYLEERLGSSDGTKGPDMRVFNKSRHLNDVDYTLVEMPYSPVIQSRGTKEGYDLKPNAQSSEENMAGTGVILSSIGIKYKGYSAQLARSFLVDPSKVGEIPFFLRFDELTYWRSHVGTRCELHALAVASSRSALQDARWREGRRRVRRGPGLCEEEEARAREAFHQEHWFRGESLPFFGGVMSRHADSAIVRPVWNSEIARGYSLRRTPERCAPIWSSHSASVSRISRIQRVESWFAVSCLICLASV